MTVKELREKLEKLPDNMIVMAGMAYDSGGYGTCGWSKNELTDNLIDISYQLNRCCILSEEYINLKYK